MTGAVVAGLVAAAVTLGGGAAARSADLRDPVDHPTPAATPQVSPDHPAMTTTWRPR